MIFLGKASKGAVSRTIDENLVDAFMAVRGIVQRSAVLYPWSTLVHCSGVVELPY